MMSRSLFPVDFDPFAEGELELTAPSTPEQQEIWTAVQLGGDDANRAFNESVSLLLEGTLDAPALERALSGLVARHEALRANLTPDGSTLCVSSPRPVTLVVECAESNDTTERLASSARAAAVTTPFDVTRGELYRFRLLRMGPRSHELVATAHHIVCDGWSMGVLLTELAALYAQETGNATRPLPAPIPFSEHARAQRDAARTPAGATDEAFWVSLYRGDAPVLDLPTERARPPERTFRAAREDWVLAPELVAGLRELGRRSGASMVATLLAGVEAWLARLSGQQSFAIGMPSAGQAASGRACLVGHCVNTLPLRADVDFDMSFSEHLGRVRAHLLDAFDHQNFTFGTLVRNLRLSRDPARVPLVPVLFNLDRSLEGLTLHGLETRIVSNPRAFESFEMFVNATQSGDEIVLETTYNTDLFTREGIRRHLDALTVLLDGAVTDPTTRVGRLPLLSAAARQQIDAFGRGPTVPPGAADPVELFEIQARRTPSAVAVSDAARSVTYAALDRESSQLARRLVSLGVRPGDRVGILLPRSGDLVLAMLGVLKTGAAYVPLDPDYPVARLRLVAEDARLAALITQLDGMPDVPTPHALVRLDADRASLTSELAVAPERPRDSSAIAYVIHTSGSTGRPKGVAVPNGAVVSFLTSMARRPGLDAEDVLVAVTTLSFDISVLELLLPLTVGARAHVVDRDTAMDGARLARSLRRERATVMQATPTSWRLLVEAGWSGSSTFKALVGGEVFPPDLAERLLERCGGVWNLYGPTETTVWSACHAVGAVDGAVPLGQPIDNTVLQVVDPRGEPCPIGVPGELLIGGVGVAQGYLGQPELTAERFGPSPLAPTTRVYRTGDLVRWSPDGSLAFERRIDGFVKLRGYRIDLGDVEAALASHPEVRECVATIREDRPGDPRLVGYVVGAPTLSLEDLRRSVGERLPAYMVPQHLAVIDELPRTPNRKIDRNALPAPRPDHAARGAEAAPRTDVERTLAAIWQELLDVPVSDVHADFFALGGHSMLATRMVSRVRDALGVEIGLRRVFRTPTIADLAAHVEATRLVAPAPPTESTTYEELVL